MKVIETNTTCILTKYIPASNTRSARIKAYAPFEGGRDRSITISYPHQLSGIHVHLAAVNALMNKFNWHADELVASSVGSNYSFAMIGLYQQVHEL